MIEFGKENKMFALLTDVSIPKGYEYLLDKTVPFTALSYSIVAMLLLVAVMVCVSVFVRRKQKGSFVTLFSGVSIFMLFNYFLAAIISAFIPKFNTAFNLILTALVSSFLPFMGRLVIIKLFSRQYTGLKEHLGYGLGIMDMKAITTMLVFVTPIANYIQINSYGVANFFPADLDAEVALGRAENLAIMFEYDYSQCMLMAIVSIAMMLHYVAISMPIYAAYTGKKSKGWFAFAFGSSFLVSLGDVMYNNDVLAIPAIILVVLIAGVNVYFAVKLYKELDDSDEDESSQSSSGDISRYAHTKIPKFNDLDKL